MTLSSTTVKDTFNGDGSTTDFATTFKFWLTSDPKVILVSSSGGETTYTEGSEYTVSGGLGATGTISISSSVVPATNETLVIKSNVPLTQETDLTPGGAFATEDVEAEVDRTVRRVQQMQEQFDRAALLSEGSTYSGITLPDPTASKVLAWNSDGDDLENITPNSSAFLSSPVAVDEGGTGRATLTDGGILVGSGTGAITALSVLSSGSVLVGDGATDPTSFQLVVGSTQTVVRHEAGGLEFDASAVTAGDIIKGSASGTMSLLSITTSGHAPVSDGSSVLSTGIIKQGTHTFILGANAFTARTTNGAASGSVEVSSSANQVMLNTFDFDPSTSEAIQYPLPMPKSWDESTLTCEFVWTVASSSDTGNVVWSCRMLSLGDNDAVDASWGTAQEVTDGILDKNDIHISSATSAITPAGTPAESDTLFIEISRNSTSASDTCALDAKLISARFTYNSSAADDS